jgi:hypothetical protein|uniref:Uncharacterized protein n=2 Tax=unclassified Caudoviricetes TaxID=2788787 RepID=A0A8S5MSJ6_9CAUD|nr:MAG TPA: hypothetical protein [Siphoviridae sp. ctckx14]DAD85204.1 MAG TPA: hypothetical protein [Siphoviridae sp. ctT3f41]DAF07744.1 MAG TPA: hypothetical protein [Caudoviricetes sp.]
MTRLVRFNEVQYVETDYDIERLMSEGFAVEELEDTEPTDDTEDTDEKPKRGGRKKAEA